MSWPPAYSAAFIGTGATTIKWGTDGIVPNNSFNGTGGGVGGYYTVESCRPSDEMEVIYIEQGSGLKATAITLWQGRKITFSVIDDTFMTPPSPASQFVANDPMSGHQLIFRITDNGSSTAAKTPGKREITAEYLTMIEGNGTVPPA